jgi:hypothetical protein
MPAKVSLHDSGLVRSRRASHAASLKSRRFRATLLFFRSGATFAASPFALRVTHLLLAPQLLLFAVLSSHPPLSLHLPDFQTTSYFIDALDVLYVCVL